jgi:hypothetical protein
MDGIGRPIPSIPGAGKQRRYIHANAYMRLLNTT